MFVYFVAYASSEHNEFHSKKFYSKDQLTAEKLAKDWLLEEVSHYLLMDKTITKEYIKQEFENKSLKEIAGWITYDSCASVQIEEYYHGDFVLTALSDWGAPK